MAAAVKEVEIAKRWAQYEQEREKARQKLNEASAVLVSLEAKTDALAKELANYVDSCNCTKLYDVDGRKFVLVQHRSTSIPSASIAILEAELTEPKK